MKTYEKLAAALREVGLEEMAKKADTGYYHDFLSPIAFPEMALAADLAALRGKEVMGSPRWHQINALRNRHLNGDFDADLAESEEWMSGPDGQEAMRELLLK